MNIIETLCIVCSEEVNDIIDVRKESYINFQRDFILFLKFTYDRLKEAEKESLSRHCFEIGKNILSFGTDEFMYNYNYFAALLADIDKIRGINSNANRYENKLVGFRGMYINFF